MNKHMLHEDWLTQNKPEIYWPMLADRENVSSIQHRAAEQQDEYGARSQQKAAAGLAAGKFTDEIVPIKVVMGAADKETSRIMMKEVTASADEGIRSDTTTKACRRSAGDRGRVIAAGNASQFSDGATRAS